MSNNKLLNSYTPERLDMNEIDMINDIEKKLEAQADLILRAKATKKQQQDQMSDMRDTQYYTVVVFCNKNDQRKFINSLQDVDIEGNTFIDGYQLAAKMGINIEMSASLPDPHYIKQLKLKK